MEKDDEVKGEGNSYTTHYRLLDPRVGRWLTRDPKFTAFESPYASMGNNPILYNDRLGDTIRLAKMADFQGKTPKYHHSKAGKSIDMVQAGEDINGKNVWTITPYYDKKDKVVGYAAGRLGKGSDYAIEYYLDKGDYANFARNLANFQLASDLFLMNGPPSEAQLSFMSGLNNGSFSEVVSGLGSMWGDAVKDPQWWAYTISAIGGSFAGGTKTLPAGGRNSAQRLADRAQNLPASARPNTVAVIETTDGKIFVGRNQGGVVNQQTITEATEVGMNQYHAQCAEINAISRAKNAGANIDGAKISVANVRGKGSTTNVHGTNKKPCSTCEGVINKNNINVQN